MQLHKPVMTFTASSHPAFRSYTGIPSHAADFRLVMCLLKFRSVYNVGISPSKIPTDLITPKRTTPASLHTESRTGTYNPIKAKYYRFRLTY